MLASFPIHMISLIMAGMVAVALLFWFAITQGMQPLPIAEPLKRGWRWGIALILIAWLLGRLLLGAILPLNVVVNGVFVAAFMTVGITAGVLPLLISPSFRQSIRAIPPTWLVGIHALRIVGFSFLALLDMKLLPTPFALGAGYGDMLVALLALGVVYWLAQRKPYARALAIGWNGLGILDFVTALVTGLLYIGPFVTQVAANGVSLTYLTYVFVIPTFGVPLFMLLHIYSLFQLFVPQTERAKQFEQVMIQNAATTKA